jgi:TetR/AcrR family transcriptional regulator, transcriptional repressor for nem operon
MAHPLHRKAQTRARIVQGAARLFAERGFARTRIEDLMQHCGLTRGGFYLHFASKAALYEEAMRQGVGVGVAVDVVAGAGTGTGVTPPVQVSADHRSAESWLSLVSDAAHPSADVRAAYTRRFQALSEHLRQQAGLAANDHGAALAAAALQVGTLAATRSTDDDGLRQQLLQACHDATRALTRSAPGLVAAADDDYVWALDDRVLADHQRLFASG